MKKQLNYSKLLLETVILTVAVAIIAAAVYFFLVPSHTSVSSISGLGIVLSNFVPLPLSAITMILNVVLLIIGFFTCGKEFGVKTVYTSIMLPLFLGLFEKIFPDFGSTAFGRDRREHMDGAHLAVGHDFFGVQVGRVHVGAEVVKVSHC